MSARPSRILLLAPPGGGKGTQGARLSPRLGVEHVAAGDLLRAEVAGGSEAGRRAAGYLRRGALVPDRLIIEVLTPALVAANRRGGYILDGFPRTLAQALEADDLGRRLGLALDAVVYLDVPDAELRRRLLARAVEQGRADDTPEVIESRLRLFAAETRPLIDLYRERRILVSVDGARDVEEITSEVMNRLGRLAVEGSARP